jgi:hypothetical protein
MFNVNFTSEQEVDFQGDVIVHVRGGKPLKMPIKAFAKIPDLEIEQGGLDFGGVTKGDSKTLPLTIYNHSDFTAKLILDIRDFEEFEISVAPT